ncbi:member of the hir1 family of wd-repeat protein [Anaeramoeba flamelloides]|uniref:Protein HIRA n=1 Tax=Anaeramoeba flamelloides TaxID=1746091 RepID=A0AAV7ZYM0_9EUKA|nr:member of the hir1 family of wd-repeat protein [Anaeramoeba flamelloides]
MIIYFPDWLVSKLNVQSLVDIDFKGHRMILMNKEGEIVILSMEKIREQMQEFKRKCKLQKKTDHKIKHRTISNFYSECVLYKMKMMNNKDNKIDILKLSPNGEYYYYCVNNQKIQIYYRKGIILQDLIEERKKKKIKIMKKKEINKVHYNYFLSSFKKETSVIIKQLNNNLKNYIENKPIFKISTQKNIGDNNKVNFTSDQQNGTNINHRRSNSKITKLKKIKNQPRIDLFFTKPKSKTFLNNNKKFQKKIIINRLLKEIFFGILKKSLTNIFMQNLSQFEKEIKNDQQVYLTNEFQQKIHLKETRFDRLLKELYSTNLENWSLLTCIYNKEGKKIIDQVWSYNNNYLAVCYNDNTINIYQISKKINLNHQNNIIKSWKIEGNQKILGINWSPNSDKILIQTDKILLIYDLSNFEISNSIKNPFLEVINNGILIKPILSVDSEYLIIPGCVKNGCHISVLTKINKRSNKKMILNKIYGHKKKIIQISFCPKLFTGPTSKDLFQYFILGDQEGTLTLWRVNSKKPKAIIRNNIDQEITNIIWLKNGKEIWVVYLKHILCLKIQIKIDLKRDIEIIKYKKYLKNNINIDKNKIGINYKNNEANKSLSNSEHFLINNTIKNKKQKQSNMISQLQKKTKIKKNKKTPNKQLRNIWTMNIFSFPQNLVKPNNSNNKLSYATITNFDFEFTTTNTHSILIEFKCKNYHDTTKKEYYSLIERKWGNYHDVQFLNKFVNYLSGNEEYIVFVLNSDLIFILNMILPQTLSWSLLTKEIIQFIQFVNKKYLSVIYENTNNIVIYDLEKKAQIFNQKLPIYFNYTKIDSILMNHHLYPTLLCTRNNNISWDSDLKEWRLFF